MNRPEADVESFLALRDAIDFAGQGAASLAAEVLQSVPDAELFEWYDKHAQYAYRWRCSKRGIKSPSPVSESDQGAPVGGDDNELSQLIYARDNYRCRYCGTQLFAWPALARLEKSVGRGSFRARGKRGEGNASRSGAAMIFRPQVDHVMPAKRGGQLEIENLVTSCWPCNYGKKHYTTEELGIADPRLRTPVEDGWDGLRHG